MCHMTRSRAREQTGGVIGGVGVEEGEWRRGSGRRGTGRRTTGRRERGRGKAVGEKPLETLGSPCTGFFWTGSTSFSSNEKPAWFSERWRLCRRREGEEQRRLREGRKVGGREERERREEVGSMKVFLT